MTGELRGRRAFISGASRGIGRAIALAFNAAGAETLLCGRDLEGLRATAKLLPRPDVGHELALLDVTDETAVVNYFAALRDGGRSPAIAVNNAGIINRSSLFDSTTEGWRRVLDVNLTGSYLVSREAARAMAGKGYGRIIMIASILGLQGKRAAIAYTASKHGVVGLTRTLAAELGPQGITVNAICPGYIKTDINTALQNDPAFDAKVREATPAGRWGMPEDVAHAAVFIASAGAAYISGHALVVDGGMTAAH